MPDEIRNPPQVIGRWKLASISARRGGGGRALRTTGTTELSGAEQSRADQTREEGWLIHSSIISYSFIHHLLKVPVIGLA
jgi:hypothetical protein